MYHLARIIRFKEGVAGIQLIEASPCYALNYVPYSFSLGAKHNQGTAQFDMGEIGNKTTGRKKKNKKATRAAQRRRQRSKHFHPLLNSSSFTS